MSGNNGNNGNGGNGGNCGSCATWRAARLRFLYDEITRLSNALSEAGATASITVDGVSTTFDRAGTLATIKEYRREIAALEGRSSSLKTFGLGGPWR